MKISRVYGDMSTEWLLRDKGEMIKNAEREQKTIEISESAISETKRKGALIYDIDATCGLIYRRKSDRKYRRTGNQSGFKDYIRYGR